MKKIIIIFLLLQCALFAQSYLISNIPLPKIYIQNLDPYSCDEDCLQEYIDNEMIFSFLSHVSSKLDNQELDDIRMMSVSILNLGSNILCDKVKIAILLPYKIIGKYASSTTNASFAYLITRNRSFELKSYKIENESVADILSALLKIKEDGFKYVIAPLTKNGADIVSELNPEINIYFPTIHKQDVNATSEFLYYGGIDYRAQNNLLLNESVSPLVIFNDRSSIGKKLANYQEERFYEINVTRPPIESEDINYSDYNDSFEDINYSQEYNEELSEYLTQEEKVIIKFTIPKRITNLERQLGENEKIQKGTFFLNTPIVKSGMIMSQLTLYDANATNILSTQINYDPLLLSMTQYKDRKNMIIANSITSNNNVLIETNSLLGNDIVYDWINYTTTVGMDYFFHLITKESRKYNIEMVDNQMVYPIELLKPSKSRFISYQKAIKPDFLY